MTKERLTYLLDRYLENTATEEELQEYANWYRQQTGAARDNLFDNARSEAAREYTDSLFQSITGRIDTAEQQQAGRRRRIVYLRWAAAASVILLAGSLLIYRQLHTTPAATASVTQQPRQDSIAINMVSIATHAAESRHIRLPDGSVVELFESSGLQYETTFGQKTRNIYLKGKGYFKVIKDNTRPFTVYSAGISTTALGTSFTITAYPGKENVEVSLHTGKVVVKQLGHSNAARMRDMYLLPGQQLTCHLKDGVGTLRSLGELPAADAKRKRPLSPGSLTGFSAAFDQVPITAVLDTIEKGYSFHIQYDKEELADMLFSGRIRETDSLSQVLNRMSALYNLNIRPTVKQYIISKNH